MKNLNKLLLLLCLFGMGKVHAQMQVQGDIQYDAFIYHSRNDDHCMTEFSSNRFVNILNSFVGDSVKFIDYNGFLMLAVENTTGASPWNVQTSMLGSYWTYDDSNVNNGTLYSNEPTNLNKIISGPDTMYVGPNGITVPVTNPCTYSTISGKIYVDNNTDCSFNSGDQNLQSVYVQGNGNYTATNSSYTTSKSNSTNSTGDYSLFIQENWIDSFRVKLPSIYAFIYPLSSCNSLSYTYTSLPQTNADFSVQCADLDLSVGVTVSGGWIRPLVPFRLYPRAKNVGCDAVSGTLKLLLDPNVTYNAANSQNPPNSISGDTMIWNYSNLTNISNGGYWNSFFGSIELTPNTNVNAGDVLTFKVWTHVPTNDVAPGNNVSTLNSTVVNSYDPNIKEVLPKGTGAENFISATTPKLRYTIHFQNTGTASAINIRVVDTLKANIIPSTMRIITSSHKMVPNWLQGNVLEFKYNNIYLADSATNEPASHGFVTFEIDMVQGLAPETRIENRAFIYFDNNPPIETPTAFNTIENPLGAGSILKSTDLNVSVYPNPAQEVVNFSINGAASDVELNIRDISGKLIFTQRYSNTKLITVESEFMSKGVYLYELQDMNTNKHSNGKLIVN